MVVETDAERIEELRIILQNEQARSVTYEEALEVADSLLIFFETLAEEPQGGESDEIES